MSDPASTAATTSVVTMEKIVNLCKRRGFVFQSSEIYGGLGSCYDYGPLGVELKRNVKEAWWRDTVTTRPDIVGLDCSILMHPRVWEASGHVANFTDPMVDCKLCKGRFRADHIGQIACPKKPSLHPGQCEGELTEPRSFNLMFKTFMGPVEDSAAVVFMRPETAQGIFVNFVNVVNSARMKPPFGIAQMGKSFRNEITPGNFLFRTREFEQMELEFFVPPGTDDAWFQYWSERRLQWYKNYGIRSERLRLRSHASDELAHYAKGCGDVEYEFPIGWQELEGVANRTDFDLKQHIEYSGKDLSFFDDQTKERYVPYVIEPSAGADRATLAFLVDSYDEDGPENDRRAVLRLHPSLAPIKVAILPLMKRDGMDAKAQEIVEMLRPHFAVTYDQAGSIGRRYRRQDEIGTPLGVTVDYDTLKDGTVTLRDRDTMSQDRVRIDDLYDIVRKKVAPPIQAGPLSPAA
ncbi:MAG TPA: glycine--tRNA ligase [Candidatus Limnocylindrales bacterium]|nr:glycine--tRNA ligase [Candidatus Limnocylindrales bacterium]